MPANTYYDHTLSHWQTPATYITYLEKVVIPDRKATIERLNLLQNQWAFVVHDLHYTVANKPFKVGIKAAFRDYLFEEYAEWVALNPDSETRGQWNPKFTPGALKEKITGFVSVAMDTLKTPVMKSCIATSSATDGRFFRSDSY